MATRTWEGTTDGDYATAGNWVEGAVPIAGDAVTIPATSTRAITGSLNQSAVTLASFTVEYGAPAMGSESAYLQVAASGTIRFAGSDTAYLDVGATATIQVDNTVTPATGYRGLYLKMSGATTLLVNGGYVGLAWKAGETSSATTIRVAGSGTSLWTGGSVTNTTLHCIDGNHIIWHGGTTMNIYNGTVITRSSGAWTTVNVYGEDGIFYPQSTGTITNGNCYGGTVDALNCGVARTVTNFRLDPGGTLRYDPAFFTISNWTAPTTAIELVTARP